MVALVLGTNFCAELFATEERAIKVIAFDAFPIFDPRPVQGVVLETFPDKGQEFNRIWRSKLFEYQWLRALGGHYKNFLEITEESLNFSARELDLELDDDTRKKLLLPFSQLTAWPDTVDAAKMLKTKGYKIVFLSNMTPEMLEAGISTAGLEGFFDHVFSTDTKRTFKPSPQAYQILIDELDVSREEVLFVAFAGWDAAGAKWFGFPTFWMNRAGAAQEELGSVPDGTGKDMKALLEFLEQRREK